MTNRLPPLIRALHDPACYDHPARDIHMIETHISWVFLTGSYAYKIKKPVNLGFLDFSTLARRRFYCEEELRLNRRLAAALYLAVIPIHGSPETPKLNGPGAVIEYAVKMVQFSQDARLDLMLARGDLRPMHIDCLAQELAEFHGRISIAGYDKPFGDPIHVFEPVHQNFEQIRPRVTAQDQAQLRRLETWSELTFANRKKTLADRKYRGFVRECHGDAHLANMVWLDQRVALFDCLEFNDNLRWIDLMSEVAFLTMDLDDRGRSDLARRVLNAYLEHTGDYDGLAVFRFYLVYRALVRAKVAAIRLGQNGLNDDEKQKVRAEYRGYAQLAEHYMATSHAALIITHGLSGSGKTWVSQQLLENFDVIRIRSDIERKRLHGFAAHERSGSGIDSGIYTAEAGRRTYTRLAECALAVLRAGHRVIADAAFLKRAQRDQLRAVAEQAGVPFVILDIRAPEPELRTRLSHRAQQNRETSEADLTVLDHQLATQEPLTADEQCYTQVVGTESSTEVAAVVPELQKRIGAS